jgi:hypothetical protein
MQGALSMVLAAVGDMWGRQQQHQRQQQQQQQEWQQQQWQQHSTTA